jgi:hypothetical protein
MSSQQKDTIYIDIDDEITTVIDKVRSSDATILALVLPKRATMLQSRVNMKLLKKAADTARKQVVLITSENSLLALAGSIGMYVAKTLQSRPEIPSAEASESFAAAGYGSTAAVLGDTAVSEDFDLNGAAEMPIGKLAKLPSEDKDAQIASIISQEASAKSAREALAGADESIELDNSIEDEPAEPETKTETKKDKKASKAKDKNLKVPNFERFRLRLIIIALLLIVLIAGFIIANIILPKALITVKTNTSSINTNLTVSLETSASAVNIGQSVVPAQYQSVPETYNEQVQTTGQQNNGASATGTVTMTASECLPFNQYPPAQDVSRGTGISANGQTFITQQDTTFSTVSSSHSGNCYVFDSTSSTPITAQNPGTASNIGPTTFSVSGRPDVTATSSTATSGGTDNIIQIVSQADINNAEQKIGTPNIATAKAKLESDLQQIGLVPITQTFTSGSPTTTTSSNVGDQATTLTVTEVINYAMFGVKQSDLQTLVDSSIDQQINTSKQMIVDDGLNNPTIAVTSQSTSSAQITLQTNAVAGPILNVASLAQQIAGKKQGDVKSLIGGIPGVTSVSVHYSPFWVSSTPTKVDKITIVIKKSS